MDRSRNRRGCRGEGQGGEDEKMRTDTVEMFNAGYHLLANNLKRGLYTSEMDIWKLRWLMSADAGVTNTEMHTKMRVCAERHLAGSRPCILPIVSILSEVSERGERDGLE